jgi:hypothetical protein
MQSVKFFSRHSVFPLHSNFPFAIPLIKMVRFLINLGDKKAAIHNRLHKRETAAFRSLDGDSNIWASSYLANLPAFFSFSFVHLDKSFKKLINFFKITIIVIIVC